MRRILVAAIVLLCAILALGPLTGLSPAPASFTVAASLNFIGWSLCIVFILSSEKLRARAIEISRALALPSAPASLEQMLQRTVRELARRLEVIGLASLEPTVRDSRERSRAVERIITRAFELFEAESAELALKDQDTDVFQSALVIGKPFERGAQEMVENARDEVQLEALPHVIVLPIAFAGTVLGSLRIALPERRAPSEQDRQLAHLVTIAIAVTLLNARYSQQLLRLKAVSEASQRAKTGFLANLSHELRGPLGIILNAGELLADGICGTINDEQRDTLKMIHGNSRHLLELINDVLDYAKVESGKVSVDPVDISLEEVLSDIISVVGREAELKRHTLAYTPLTEPVAIRCDRRHLRQMLINLLTNAIKYTPEGGRIELRTERAPQGRVRILVSDTGVGIDPSDRERVFAPFDRIENAYSIKQVGTGLGLALTRKLAEVNGGAIDFSSTPGHGTVFWLSFPSVAVGPFTEQGAETASGDTVQGKGSRILIFHTRNAECEMLHRYLESVGFSLLTADTREAACEVLRQRTVHLLIVDSHTLDSASDGLIRELREASGNPTLPVVSLSSHAFAFDVERYLRRGIDRALSRPLPLHELARVCRELIDQCPPTQTVVHTNGNETRVSRRVAVRGDEILH